MGELHLEIIVDRMMREYKVEANVGKPQWRIANHSQARRGGRQYIRQTGGRGSTVTPRSSWIRNPQGRATSSLTTS